MPPPKVAKTLARVMGVVFVLVGLAAFVPNPVIGFEGFLKTDLFLNVLYLLGGGVLLASSNSGEGTATTGLYSVAMFMLLVALAGFTLISKDTFGGPVQVLNFITFYPESVKFLGGSAAVLIVSGLMNTSSKQLVRD